MRYDSRHLGKLRQFTFTYQISHTIKGIESVLVIWQYYHKVVRVTSRQLTINDPVRVTEEMFGMGLTDELLAESTTAIENDEIIRISTLQLLYRITIGGYIARRRLK